MTRHPADVDAPLDVVEDDLDPTWQARPSAGGRDVDGLPVVEGLSDPIIHGRGLLREVIASATILPRRASRPPAGTDLDQSARSSRRKRRVLPITGQARAWADLKSCWRWTRSCTHHSSMSSPDRHAADGGMDRGASHVLWLQSEDQLDGVSAAGRQLVDEQRGRLGAVTTGGRHRGLIPAGLRWLDAGRRRQDAADAAGVAARVGLHEMTDDLVGAPLVRAGPPAGQVLRRARRARPRPSARSRPAAWRPRRRSVRAQLASRGAANGSNSAIEVRPAASRRPRLAWRPCARACRPDRSPAPRSSRRRRGSGGLGPRPPSQAAGRRAVCRARR